MIARKQGWLSARVGDEIVMMNAERGHYMGLNEVGARIWDMIEEPKTVAAVCSALVAEFDITPEACEKEVDAFVAELEKHGAVSVDRP